MERAPGERGLAADLLGGEGPLVSRSRELESASIGPLLGTTDRPRVTWTTPDGPELTGCGAAARFVATGTERFRRIEAAATARFDALDHDGPRAARPRAFGGFAFHDDPDPDRTGPWRGFQGASFVVPRVQVSRSDDGDGPWLTAVGSDDADATATLDRWAERLRDAESVGEGDTSPGIAETRRTTDRAAWTAQVTAALDRIDRGELRKVVLAQALCAELESPIDLAATLDRLGRRYPNCYRFAIAGEVGATFFGAPPERLVAKRGSTLETEALAGSVPRGETPAEADAHVDRMVASEKAQREHGLVVEAIREQLAPLAREVRVDDQTVRRLATIQHLRTPITAEVTPDSHVLDVVAALHPTPAVGGVPQTAACETIRALETFDRGWYAGPVGWFDAAGDGEFAVGIRSAVAADRAVTCFGGNGIVADSDPDEEWDEVQLKVRAILDELR